MCFVSERVGENGERQCEGGREGGGEIPSICSVMNVDTYKRRHEYIETSYASARVLHAWLHACAACVRARSRPTLHVSRVCERERPLMSVACERERETVHVRDVEEAVAAAHFDEGTIVGHALDNAWPHLHHTHKHTPPHLILSCVCVCVCVCSRARARARERERERERER